MSRPIVVLGATGSIGSQTLEVALALGLDVAGIAVRRPRPELIEIARSHADAQVVVTGATSDEAGSLTSALGERVAFGLEALLELASLSGVTVMNGIVGAAGLRASVAAIEAGNRLALANKESLVAGGPVLVKALAGGGELIPVDSEHSAIHQCLVGEPAGSVRRLVITASGGPFRGRTASDLSVVTPEQALRHPTWEMGRRITIDSATLFNKGLEVIEAHYLFEVPYDQIDVVVHPQSILHSAVEFQDGSWKGQFGHPDMRIPIQYAVTFPERLQSPVPVFDLAGLSLDFEEVDRDTFPALDLAYSAGRAGGSAPAVLNAADEIAVEAFLQGRIGFTMIASIVEMTLDEVEWREVGSIDAVMEADGDARATAAGLVARAC